MAGKDAPPVRATPSGDGYAMPGRFERHARTLLTWPPIEEEVGTDVDGFRDEVEATARAISRCEPVTLIVDPRDEGDARSRLGGEVELLVVPVDCCWLRDNGPIFVRSEAGDVAGVHFGFNGWGGRFPCVKTQEMPSLVVEHLGFHCYRTPFICEGGGISVDGEGTLITTEQVMRNDNRYRGMSRDRVEAMLHDHLGITKVIWLGLGLVEDIETDGHVDNVVEFIEPGRVLVQVVSERSNPNHALLQENLRRLAQATDAKGRSLDIVEMPVLPYQQHGSEHYVIPYTNAYICNGAIIAPQVDPRLDDLGWSILEDAFPGREVVPVPSLWQAVGGGGLGCITQQVPACVSAPGSA